MLTFKTLINRSTNYQMVYLIPNGGITAAYCYNALHGPFGIDSTSTSDKWRDPPLSTYTEVGFGPPWNPTGSRLGQENPCRHDKIDGEVTILTSDVYGDNLPYEPKGKVLVFTDSIDNKTFYQTTLSPYQRNTDKSMTRYDRGSTVARTFTHPRLGAVYPLRKPGEFDSLWVKTRVGSYSNWWTKTNYVSQITPDTFHQEYHWVNEWLSQYGEIERQETIYDCAATTVSCTNTGVTVQYSGVRTYRKWSYGVLVESTSTPYSTSATGWYSSPPLTYSVSADTTFRLARDKILMRCAPAIQACKDANASLNAYAVVCSALESVSPLDMNNIENAVQLKGPGAGFLPPIKELVQLSYDFENPKKWLKASSSLYLWYKYCVKPTCGDVDQLLKNQAKILHELTSGANKEYGNYRSLRSERSLLQGYDVESYCAANIKLRPRANSLFSSILRKLDYVGLSPTFANVWDLIPFSFVVDWFVNVGDALRQFDMSTIASTYDVGGCTVGRRSEVTLSPDDWDLPKTVTCSAILVSSYDRSVSAFLPPMELELGSPDPSRHIVDGAALIIANW